MKLTKAIQDGKKLEVRSDGNAHFIKLKKAQNRIGSVELIEIFYEGKPREAINAPWDGGLSWKKDLSIV